MRSGVALALIAGCSFHPGRSSGDGGGTDTPSSDGPGSDGSTVTTCLGITYPICTTFPQVTIDVTGAFNTGTDPRCTVIAQGPSKPDLCVVAGRTIHLSSVMAFGTRALVFAATDAITATGTIDASSHRGGVDGPAANFTGCAAGGGPGLGSATGGGGPGGSFRSKGGNGGNGGAGVGGGTAANADAGAPGAVLRGGCPGVTGGGGSGIGGSGGGVIYLVCGNTLVLDAATIDASGAGADGGTAGIVANGGGGGGTGGMIVLFATTSIAVMNGVMIYANGGGGGAGAGDDTVTSGQPGSDPSGSSTAGGGGIGAANGSSGTPGSINGMNATNATNAGAGGGGGGGGGGAGLLRANHPLGSAALSPAIS